MLNQLEHLKKSFEPCLPRGRAYDIVAYMVDATLKQLAAGGSAPIRFNKDNFVAACHEGQDPAQVDANKWVPKTQALHGVCCASVLGATKRIEGREAASQIASASTKSFLFDLTNGRTNWGEISLVSCPSALISRAV